MTDYPYINAVVFALIGIAVFAAAIAILAKAAPLRIWEEVVKERNTAVAILAGAVAIGVAIIVAATMH